MMVYENASLAYLPFFGGGGAGGGGGGGGGSPSCLHT